MNCWKHILNSSSCEKTNDKILIVLIMCLFVCVYALNVWIFVHESFSSVSKELLLSVCVCVYDGMSVFDREFWWLCGGGGWQF